MAYAVELSMLAAGGDVDWALGHAAVHGRFATGDLDSIVAAKGIDTSRGRASECTSLAQGTSGWTLVGTNHHRGREDHRVNALAATTGLPADVEALMRQLRLSHARAIAAEVLAPARSQCWDPTEVIKALLSEDAAGRAGSMLVSRRKAAGFPTGTTFGCLGWKRFIDPAAHPAGAAYPRMGPPPGKPGGRWPGRHRQDVLPRSAGPTSHRGRYARGLVHPRTDRGAGRRPPADDWLAKAIAKIVRAEPVVIDDVGLLPVGTDAADGLYRIVEAADERKFGGNVVKPCIRAASTN